MTDYLLLKVKTQAKTHVQLFAELASLTIALLLAGCGGSAGSGTTSTLPSTPVSPVPDPIPVVVVTTSPSAPTITSAVPGDGSISLTFAKPASDGGSAIVSYTGRCSPSAGTGVSRSATTSPIVVTGLTNGTLYTCTVSAGNAAGTGPLSEATSSTPVALQSTNAFRGNIILGNPTNSSVVANVFAPDQSGTVWLVYGSTPGLYDAKSNTSELIAAKPLEIKVTGLSANTRYFYRLYLQSSDSATSGYTPEYSFQTARSSGSAFTFAIQGDSHPERLKTQFDPDLYTRTLTTVAADKPDFYILSGDDFSVDTLEPATINAEKVTERYTFQRPYLGIVGNSSPLFMVNGNHEQAAAYLLDGTPNNVAVWAQNARNTHYTQPAPDGFYTGNSVSIPYVGLLRNYFAWTWGDALFVTIDPYWASPVAVDNQFGGTTKRLSMWDVTHGDAQYQWLKKTLEESKAKYKFVFAHHVMGTGRGGIELVRQWEWGGEDAKGISYFAIQRPTWPSPIHQLFVKNGVTIFFQGHDHIWVHQQIDGVTYQTLSEPADPNYTLWNSDAFLSGDKFPNTGYTRVSVAPSGVKVEYVRTYLPKDEGPGKVSGSTVFSYTIP